VVLTWEYHIQRGDSLAVAATASTHLGRPWVELQACLGCELRVITLKQGDLLACGCCEEGVVAVAAADTQAEPYAQWLRQRILHKSDEPRSEFHEQVCSCSTGMLEGVGVIAGATPACAHLHAPCGCPGVTVCECENSTLLFQPTFTAVPDDTNFCAVAWYSSPPVTVLSRPRKRSCMSGSDVTFSLRRNDRCFCLGSKWKAVSMVVISE